MVFKRFQFLLVLFAVVIVFASASTSVAKDDPPKQMLFTNVKVFNGTGNKLNDVDVLVEGNLIKEVRKGAKATAPGAVTIDGGGRTLMPGLIEAHAHLSLHGNLFQMRNDFNWMYIGAKSGAEAQRMLMRGFRPS